MNRASICWLTPSKCPQLPGLGKAGARNLKLHHCFPREWQVRDLLLLPQGREQKAESEAGQLGLEPVLQCR